MYDNWPYAEIIQEARCGFYFWRNWRTVEQHNEVLLLWQDFTGECHIKCYVSQSNQSEIIKYEIISTDFLHQFLDIAQRNGILDLSSQLTARSSSHGDDYVGIKTVDAVTNSYIVKAMRHDDSRHEAIVLLSYAISPELVTYYGLSLQGVRKRLRQIFNASGISISPLLIESVTISDRQ